MSVAPGWYVDPADPTTQRYWDGEGWVGASLPADATPPTGPLPEPPAAEPEPAPEAPAPTEPAGAAGAPPQPGTPLPPGTPPPGIPLPPSVPPPFGYRPPQPRPHGLPLASNGRRLAARLIDFGLILVLSLAVNSVFIWRLIPEYAPVWREVQRILSGGTPSDTQPQLGEQAAKLQLMILLVATALWFAYEVPAIANRGQTLGKRLMGIRVVALAEDPTIGLGRSIRRWHTLGLPTLLWYCCGLGLIFQFIDALSPLFDPVLRQALHDRQAQTVVVRLPDRSATAKPSAPHQHPPSAD